MSWSSRKQTLVLVIVAMAVFAVLAIPRLAYALPCEEHYWQYFTDATYTTVVGGDGRDCFGNRSPYWWGQQTSYWTYEECCCDNPDCNPPGGEFGCNPGTLCSHGPCPSINLC